MQPFSNEMGHAKKRFMKITFILLPVFIILIFSGCRCRDHVTYDFNLKISDTLSKPKYGYYYSITALKALKPIAGIDSTSAFNYGYNQFNLPVSFKEDVTTYIFKGTKRTDTLTISYKRSSVFYSNLCGFEIEISDFKLIKPSTFKLLELNGNMAEVSRY